MPHSLRAKIKGLRYKGILEDKDYKRLCHALDLEKAEQEPCDDAISREELLKAIDTWDKFGVDDTNSLFRLDNLSLPYYVPYIHYDDVIKCIKGMPSVTQSGKWIKKEDDTCWWYACSECEQEPLKNRWNDDDVLSAFCPNCGAKMESEDKE